MEGLLSKRPTLSSLYIIQVKPILFSLLYAEVVLGINLSTVWKCCLKNCDTKVIQEKIFFPLTHLNTFI